MEMGWEDRGRDGAKCGRPGCSAEVRGRGCEGRRPPGGRAVRSGLGASGRARRGCGAGTEDGAWRRRGGRRGRFGSKSFKTGETLFPRNVKVPEVCAVDGGNEKIGF